MDTLAPDAVLHAGAGPGCAARCAPAEHPQGASRLAVAARHRVAPSSGACCMLLLRAAADVCVLRLPLLPCRPADRLTIEKECVGRQEIARHFRKYFANYK